MKSVFDQRQDENLDDVQVAGFSWDPFRSSWNDTFGSEPKAGSQKPSG